MKSNDALHVLIHSMSKSEKRHFKIYQGSGKKSNYIKLFDAIDKQEEYNEDQLKVKFKNEKFVKHIHVIKNQLGEKILTSLREFHREKNPNQLILDKIADADILYQRGLYDMSFKYLEKARELIEEHESYGLFINYYSAKVLLWQKEGMLKTSEEELNHISEEASDFLDYQQSHIDMLKVSQLLNKKAKTVGYPRNEKERKVFEDIMSATIMTDISKVKTTKAKFNFYTNYSFFYLLTGQKELCLENNLKAIEAIEQKALSNNSFVLDYIRGLSNLLYLTITFKDFDYYKSIKEKLKNVTTIASHDSSTKKLGDLKLIELQYLTLTNSEIETSRIQELINELEEWIQKTEITPNDKTTMTYYVAVAYFMLKEHDTCLDKLYPLIDNQKGKINPLFLSVYLLVLLCHYELKNYEYLNSLLRNTKRTLLNQNLYGSFETEVFNYIRKGCMYDKDPKKMKKYKQALLKQIQETPKEEASALFYFNYERWLNES